MCRDLLFCLYLSIPTLIITTEILYYTNPWQQTCSEIFWWLSDVFQIHGLSCHMLCWNLHWGYKAKVGTNGTFMSIKVRALNCMRIVLYFTPCSSETKSQLQKKHVLEEAARMNHCFKLQLSSAPNFNSQCDKMGRVQNILISTKDQYLFQQEPMIMGVSSPTSHFLRVIHFYLNERQTSYGWLDLITWQKFS